MKQILGVTQSKLFTLAKEVDNKCCANGIDLYFGNSESVALDGNGSFQNPITAYAIISASPGNTLVLNSDGLFVGDNSGGGENLQITTDLGNHTTNTLIVTNNLQEDKAVTSCIQMLFDPASFPLKGGMIKVQDVDSIGGLGTLQLYASEIFIGATVNGITEAPFDNSNKLASTAWVNQAIGAIPPNINIYNSDGTLTGNRLVNGNTNQLSFGNMGDFRVQCSAFASFILNDTTFLLTDGVNGTIAAQGGNLSHSSMGNIVIWAASSNALNKSIECKVGLDIPLTITDLTDGIAGAFTGRVSGIDAINNNEFTTLSQVTGLIPPPADLQAVTTVGNTSDNTIVVTGTNNFQSIEGLQFAHATGLGSNILSYDPIGPFIYGILGFGAHEVSLQCPDNAGVGRLLSITASGTGSALSMSAEQISVSFGDLQFVSSGNSPFFNTTVVGQPATLPSEFVTLSQLTSTSVTIVSTSLSSTSIDQTYMNTNYSTLPIGNTVWFTNLSDDATKVLIVNKIGATTWSANADTKLT